MHVQLGQLYDLRYSLNINRLCIGEVLMPLTLLDATHLRIAVESLFNKYAILRARFTGDGMNMQMDFLPPNHDLLCRAFEVRSSISDQRDYRQPILNYIAEVQSIVDVANPPLFRYCLFDGDYASEQRLVLIFNHLVCDGISSRILWRDLSRAYRLSTNGQVPCFAQATAYQQLCAELYDRYLQKVTDAAAMGSVAKPVVNKKAVDMLQGERVAALPISRLADAVIETRQLACEVLERIRYLAQKYHVTVAHLFLASWLQALAVVFGKGDLTMMLWVTPHFVGHWKTTLTDLVGSVSFPISADFTIDPQRSLEHRLLQLQRELEEIMEKAADYAATYFVPHSIFAWPELPAVAFNFIGDQRCSATSMGYALAPENIRIKAPDEERQEIPLSLEVERYGNVMDITISARPDYDLHLLPRRLMVLLLKNITASARDLDHFFRDQ